MPLLPGLGLKLCWQDNELEVLMMKGFSLYKLINAKKISLHPCFSMHRILAIRVP